MKNLILLASLSVFATTAGATDISNILGLHSGGVIGMNARETAEYKNEAGSTECSVMIKEESVEIYFGNQITDGTYRNLDSLLSKTLQINGSGKASHTFKKVAYYNPLKTLSKEKVILEVKNNKLASVTIEFNGEEVNRNTKCTLN